MACELISILQVNYEINSVKLLACMHDRAATLHGLLKSFSQWLLISVATLILVGEKFDQPV